VTERLQDAAVSEQTAALQESAELRNQMTEAEQVVTVALLEENAAKARFCDNLLSIQQTFIYWHADELSNQGRYPRHLDPCLAYWGLCLARLAPIHERRE